jgi:hypothetical protein
VKRRESGYAALLAVLVTGAVATAIALVLNERGRQSAQRAYRTAIQASASSCRCLYTRSAAANPRCYRVQRNGYAATWTRYLHVYCYLYIVYGKERGSDWYGRQCCQKDPNVCYNWFIKHKRYFMARSRLKLSSIK